jgi:hypothetical protein
MRFAGQQDEVYSAKQEKGRLLTLPSPHEERE